MSCQPGCSACERLRTAALEIVGDAGIEGLSLRALAEGGGCSVAQVRRHYRTAWDCLYATYDELSFRMFVDYASDFREPTRWEDAFRLAHHRLLLRLAARPAEARLAFVEAVRGDERMRHRRAITRQWVIGLISQEHQRRCREGFESGIQIEMLAGAVGHVISAAIAEGPACELPAIEPTLANLLEVFTPATA
jgi:AcrR family transcriptional regulator